MDILKFVPEQLAILVVALYILGMFLKDTPKIPNWIIPWALIIVGVVGSIGLVGFSATAVIQGIICAGATVLTNQLIKQTTNGINGSKE